MFIRSILRRGAPLVAGVALLGMAGTTPALHAQTPTPQAVETVELFRGCNNVALTWSAGTPIAEVARAVNGTLASIWAFDNASQSFSGFSPVPGAPSDFTATTARAQPVYICMESAGTLMRPVI